MAAIEAAVVPSNRAECTFWRYVHAHGYDVDPKKAGKRKRDAASSAEIPLMEHNFPILFTALDGGMKQGKEFYGGSIRAPLSELPELLKLIAQDLQKRKHLTLQQMEIGRAHV